MPSAGHGARTRPHDVPFARNLGECPPHARGKHVRVKLRNGICPPAPWPAATTNWAFTPEGRRSRDFDVAEYEVIGDG
jgi:hypothetical protein